MPRWYYILLCPKNGNFNTCSSYFNLLLCICVLTINSGYCMMRKNLYSPDQVMGLPSLLGRYFRLALNTSVDQEYGSEPKNGKAFTNSSDVDDGYTVDNFDYSILLDKGTDSLRDKSWSDCRNMMGIQQVFILIAKVWSTLFPHILLFYLQVPETSTYPRQQYIPT